MNLYIDKHPFKELYRISVVPISGSSDDWKIALFLNKTETVYQRNLTDLGASPESEFVPRNQWSKYQLWFRSKSEAQSAIEWFEAEELMKTMSRKPSMEKAEDY